MPVLKYKSKLDKSIQVGLEKQGVGGFTWQARLPLPAGISITALKPEMTKTIIPGSGAKARFEISATAAGLYELIFDYKRSWEPVALAGKTVLVTASFE